MPLFGGHKEENDKLQAEVERLAGLPLPELAGEIIAKGFGSGGPAGDGHYAELGSVAGALNLAQGSFLSDDLLVQHFRIVAEGAQLLEHAGLVRFEIASSGGITHWSWTATRAGVTALEQDSVQSAVEPLAHSL